MTPNQVLRQIRRLAVDLVDGSGQPVFGEGGARLAADAAKDQFHRLPGSAVLLRRGPWQTFKESRRRGSLFVDAMIVVKDSTDPFGGEAMLQLGTVEELWLSQFAQLERTGGLEVIAAGASATVPDKIDHARFLVMTHRLVVRHVGYETHADKAPPAAALVASIGGAVNANLTWDLPPGTATRYDWLGISVRRGAGATAPASVTDGTEVLALNATALGMTEQPGTGTWSYSVFCHYDVDEIGSADTYSAAVSATVTIA